MRENVQDGGDEKKMIKGFSWADKARASTITAGASTITAGRTSPSVMVSELTSSTTKPTARHSRSLTTLTSNRYRITGADVPKLTTLSTIRSNR